MRIRSARTAMQADRDSCATWRSLGGYLLLENGHYFIGYDPPPGDPRRPSPYPLSVSAAREAENSGMPVRRADDLFARAA